MNKTDYYYTSSIFIEPIDQGYNMLDDSVNEDEFKLFNFNLDFIDIDEYIIPENVIINNLNEKKIKLFDFLEDDITSKLLIEINVLKKTNAEYLLNATFKNFLV
jgi:hypothetical protein